MTDEATRTTGGESALQSVGASLLARLRHGVGLGTSAAGAIGFDLGAEALHLVQFERRAQAPALRAALSLPCPGGREALLAAPRQARRFVAGALRQGGFRGRRVVTTLPAADLKLMVLNYHADPRRSDAETVLALVAERIDEPVQDCSVDFLPIRTSGESEAERCALAAVAPRAAVLSHLGRLQALGLEPEAVEIAPVAARRLVAWLTRGAPQENALVLQCGREMTHLSVLWGRRLLLYHPVDFGEQQAVEALAKGLDLPPAEAAAVLAEYGLDPERGTADEDGVESAGAQIGQTVAEILRPVFASLAERVQRALVYTASRMRGASVDRVYLLGGVAPWPGAAAVLSELCGLPVKVLDVGVALAREGARQAGPSAQIALAAGLALRGMEADG